MKSAVPSFSWLFAFGFAINLLANCAWAQENAETKYQLKGVWAGVAYLDEEKLKQKIDALPTIAERKALLTKAELFLSAVAAYEFKDNNDYETDCEINTDDGEIARAATIGRYKIVETDGLKMIVEFVEKTKEATAAREKKLVQFYEDGNHMAILVPAPEELADCNPLLVFERVRPEQIADPESIAKEPGKSTIK